MKLLLLVSLLLLLPTCHGPRLIVQADPGTTQEVERDGNTTTVTSREKSPPLWKNPWVISIGSGLLVLAVGAFISKGPSSLSKPPHVPTA